MTRTSSSSLPLRRRSFLTGLGALALLPAGCDDPRALGERWVSAQGDDEASYGLVAADPDGIVSRVHTGFRGHGLIQRPGDPSRVVMFGRRPGAYAVEVDLDAERITRTLELPANRRLQGHGCFAEDGRLLLTSEADTSTGEGFVGVRDGETFALIRELPTFGIGPHELALMPDGATIVVANGGILTRPDTGAEKLNLDTMRSSLTYLELETGAQRDELRVPEDKASLRHLAVCDDGAVVVVMQVQREVLDHEDPVPLVAVHTPGGSLTPLEDGLELVAAMQDYAGAVAVHDASRVACVTSPRGDLAVFWNIDSGVLLGHHQLHDVCGVTVSSDRRHFVLSGSGGQLRLLDPTTLAQSGEASTYADVRWDNHMIALRA